MQLVRETLQQKATIVYEVCAIDSVCVYVHWCACLCAFYNNADYRKTERTGQKLRTLLPSTSAGLHANLPPQSRVALCCGCSLGQQHSSQCFSLHSLGEHVSNNSTIETKWPYWNRKLSPPYTTVPGLPGLPGLPACLPACLPATLIPVIGGPRKSRYQLNRPIFISIFVMITITTTLN